MFEEPEVQSEPITVRVEVDAKAALAAVEGLEDRLHAEVETFWQNIFANVSSHVETPIHNFIHDEKEALKARLSALFHKEA